MSPHSLSECSTLIASTDTPVNIDVSYHSFPPPDDTSFWAKKFPRVRSRLNCAILKQPQLSVFNLKNAPWTIVLFGQSIAIALAIGNFSFAFLGNSYHIRVPALEMGIVYLVLSFHLVYLFGRQVLYRKKENREKSLDTERFQQNCAHSPSRDIADKVYHESVYTFPLTNLTLHTPWHAYLLLAILDVEANYLTMLSFQHTSLSSSMLLTSLSVFSTLLFRRCIFGKASVSYSCKKILGVFISVVGACLWIRKDFRQGNGPMLSSNGHEIINGDFLAIASALLYGLNDVLLEYIVKINNDRIEYLGMIGLFGFLFSCCVQAPILETKEISNLLQSLSSNKFPDRSKIVCCVFVVMMSYFYISVTIFLSVTDATVLNLSLQLSPLWAVILTRFTRVGIGNPDWDLPPACFFVGFAMVVCGMFLYEGQPVKK
ncbi:hypothetical protein ACHAW6_004350 [Cyclotella cf. meneghiniana]